MSITENIRMTIKVCQLYYEENLSQKEISSHLGISRPQISRLLSYARQQHIVTIKINNPYLDETLLERKLVERYGLQDALVLNCRGSQDREGRLEEFGRMVAEHLDAYISDNSRVGVMSGQTISKVIWSIKHFQRRGLEIVPLVGGIGSASVNWHANAIAQRFAECSGGSCYILNAPVIVQSRQSRDMLLNEPAIASVLEKGAACDVAIVGIGQVDMKSTTVQAGALVTGDIERLKKAGAVASVCTSYLNSSGKIIKTELDERSIGQTLMQLKKCKTIALAIGQSKAQAIKAALSGGNINVFVTNLETARAVIDETD